MKAVTFTVRHDIRRLACTIDSVLKTIQSEHCVCDDILFEIKVVLNELIVNAMCHGNNCEDEKVAKVTFKLLNDDSLYISVKDEGCGFTDKMNMERLDEYIESRNESLCEHGRGLIIVEQLCDRVKFNRCGNRVSIIKRL